MTQICLLFLPTERHMLLAAALLYTSAGGGSENSRGGCWDEEGAAILLVNPVFVLSRGGGVGIKLLLCNGRELKSHEQLSRQ